MTQLSEAEPQIREVAKKCETEATTERSMNSPYETVLSDRLSRCAALRRAAQESGDTARVAQLVAVQGELTAILTETAQRVHGLGCWRADSARGAGPQRKTVSQWERDNPELAQRIWWRLVGDFHYHEFVIQEAQGFCESPIEQKLIVAILTDPAYNQSAAPVLVRPGQRLPTAADKADERIYVAPQYKVDRYRVDIAVFWPPTGRRIAVECDGAEFHDNDPKANARDKERDRALMEAGWATARYTGKEINADVFAQAAQVSRLLTELSPDAQAEVEQAMREAGL